jgi:hypothetical protein
MQKEGNLKFENFVKKLVAVPKKKIDEQLEREREEKQKKKEGKKR